RPRQHTDHARRHHQDRDSDATSGHRSSPVHTRSPRRALTPPPGTDRFAGEIPNESTGGTHWWFRVSRVRLRGTRLMSSDLGDLVKQGKTFVALPDPGAARTLDELAEGLRSLKIWAGDPSYEVIADRINAAWLAIEGMA